MQLSHEDHVRWLRVLLQLEQTRIAVRTHQCAWAAPPPITESPRRAA